MGYRFKIFKEDAKKVEYTHANYIMDDGEDLSDSSIFDEYDYLELDSNGDLEGVIGDVHYDIFINEDNIKILDKEDIKQLKKLLPYEKY